MGPPYLLSTLLKTTIHQFQTSPSAAIVVKNFFICQERIFLRSHILIFDRSRYGIIEKPDILRLFIFWLNADSRTKVKNKGRGGNALLETVLQE
jgi:hypothetical protein